MLLTMKELLDRANSENYAIAAPVAQCELQARTAIETAEELNAPLIINIAYRGGYDLDLFGRYLVQLCKDALVPVALNLDHGANFEVGVRAIRAGFSSIMADRSQLPYEENVAQVKELVKIAHALGVSVEAELGHVGQAANYEHDGKNALTDPAQAVQYIGETGVDCLAVAVGTAHGAYAGNVKPYIDFQRLAAIKKATGNFPLVLHGGSGTGDEALRKACTMGINKVNIANDLFRSVSDLIQSSDMSGNNAYQLSNKIKEGYGSRLAELMDVFGSRNKAWIPEIKNTRIKEEAITADTIH